MADTPELLTQLEPRKGVSFPFLVPNDRGLSSLLKLIAPEAAAHGRTDEIAIFTAATDGFSKANTNASVTESLERLEGVARAALDAGLRVRGYVSVVAGCPYEGSVEPRRVADVAKALLDMGVYEVSLGDTVGQGTPASMRAVLNECTRYAAPEMFAAHCHDTFGTGLANVMAMVEMGVRTVDTSVAGLGGCPYSPGEYSVRESTGCFLLTLLCSRRSNGQHRHRVRRACTSRIRLRDGLGPRRPRTDRRMDLARASTSKRKQCRPRHSRSCSCRSGKGAKGKAIERRVGTMSFHSSLSDASSETTRGCEALDGPAVGCLDLVDLRREELGPACVSSDSSGTVGTALAARLAAIR